MSYNIDSSVPDGADYIDSVMNGLYSASDEYSKPYTGEYDSDEIESIGSMVDPDVVDIGRELHDRQSGLSSLGSALNQAVVGEIAGGTLEGLGYLLDMPQYLDLLKGTEKEFSNALSDAGKNIREWTQESTPVYADPFKEGEFAPEDWSWWTSNLPSVASTLSLMIPAAGAVRAASMGAKALGGLNKLSKGTKWTAKGIGQAVASRHMENLMEGAGTMEGIVEELSGAVVGDKEAKAISDNYGILLIPDEETGAYTISPETAQEIGAKAASSIYKANWAMLAQDIPQYMMLGKAFGKSSQELTAGVAKVLGKDVVAPIAKKGAAIAKDMVGEGFEEGYQYVVAERSRENALVDAGLAKQRSLEDAIDDYTSRGEMATSMFFGALGSGVMQTAGKGVSNAMTRSRGAETLDESRINDIKQAGERFQGYLTAKTLAADTRNEGFNNSLDVDILSKMAVKHAQNGNLEAAIEIMHSVDELSNEESSDLGVTDELKEASKKRKVQIEKDMRRVGKLYDQNVGTHGPKFAGLIAQQQFAAEKYGKISDINNSDYTKHANEWVDNGVLSPAYKESFRIKNYEVPARQVVISQLEQAKSKAEQDGDTGKVDLLQSKIDAHNKEIFELKERSKEVLNDREQDVRAQDKAYEGKTLNVGRGRKRVPAVKAHMAPKSEEAVDALVNSLMAKEISNISVFESSRLSNPKYQASLEKEAVKIDKENAAKNASDPDATVEDVRRQKEQAAGTPVESAVSEAHSQTAQSQRQEVASEVEDPREDQTIEDVFGIPPAPTEAPAPIEDQGEEFQDDDAKFANRIFDENWEHHEDPLPEKDALSQIIQDNNSQSIEAFADDIANATDNQMIKDKFNEVVSKSDLLKRLAALVDFIKHNNANNNTDSKNYNDAITAIKKATSIINDTMASHNQESEETSDSLSDKEAIDNSVEQATPVDIVDSIDGNRNDVKNPKKKKFYRLFTKGASRNSFWGVDRIFKGGKEENGEHDVSKEIRRDMINNGEIPIGSTIFFELDKKSSDYGMDKNEWRPIRMVVYQNGNRHVVGTVDVTSDVQGLRNMILEDLDSKKSGSKSRYVQSKYTSKVDGFTAKFSRTKDFRSPLKVTNPVDRTKNLGIGGIKLAYTKKDADNNSWFIPSTGKKVERISTNIPYEGQVGMIVTNPLTGEEMPLIGFAKKMKDIDSKKAAQIKKKALEVINKADGTNDKKLASELKKIIILHKDFRSKGAAYYKANPSEFNKAFATSILNIDKNKLNNPVQSDDWGLGFESDTYQYFNEAIAEFIEFNISEGQYLDGTSLLVDREIKSEEIEIIEVAEDALKSKDESKPIVNENEAEKIAEDPKPEVTEKKADVEGDGSTITPKPEDKPSVPTNTANSLIEQAMRNRGNKRTKVAPKDDYTKKWDKKEELAWLKQNLPGVRVGEWNEIKEIIKNGPELWGVFKDASIYISENAGAGTAYHEAFHAVFNLYLGEKEALNVLVSYAKEKGLKQPKNMSEAIAIEEAIADEFADYVRSNKIVKPESWLKRVFDKLLKVMGIVKGSTVTEELFSKINQGYYSNATVKPGLFGSDVTRNSVARWTGKHTKDVAQAINQHMLMTIIPSEIAKGNIPKGYNTAEALDYIIKNGEFKKLYESIRNDFRELKKSYDSLGIEDLSQVLVDILDNMFDENGDFGKAINASIRALDYYNGIKVSKKSASVITDDTQESENPMDNETSFKENWINGATERSAKDNVPQYVKDFIRYLKVPGYSNLIGLDQYVDYQSTYNKLLLDTAGSISVEEMIDRITKVYDSGLSNNGTYNGFTPEYKEIIERLSNDKLLATKFFNAFSKQHAVYTHINRANDGTFKVFEANKTGVTNRIVNEWVNSVAFDSAVLTTDENGKQVVDTERAKIIHNDIISKILEKNEDSLTDNDFINLSSAMMKYGIELPVESIRYAFESDNFYYGIKVPVDYISDAFSKGTNPFDFEGTSKEEIVGEKKQIKELANTVKYSKPSLFESSFKNVEGKTVYSHIVPNFLSTLVHKLTGDKALEEIKWYNKDKFYRKNPILKELTKNITSNERLSTIFNVSILDGMSESGNKTWHSKMSTADRLTMALSLFENNANQTYSKYLGPVLSDAPNQIIFNMNREQVSDSIESLIDLASSEYARMQQQGKNEDGKGIEFFDETTPMYHIAPMFNGFKGDPAKNKDAARERIKKWLIGKDGISGKAGEFIKELDNSGVIVRNEDGTINEAESRLPNNSWNIATLYDKVQEFYINDFVMNAAFSVLTVGDPAFYKGQDNKSVDYYKRAKEIYSPKFIPDVTASYEGVEAGTHYTTAYLFDEKIQAQSYDALKEALGNHPKAVEILAHYGKKPNGKGKVNVTDAQAYITLPFYKRTMISLGRWNERYEDAYKRLEQGKGTGNDLILVMQPLKPFVYGHVYDEVREKIVPVQHKNSEYLLLPQLAKSKDKDGNIINETLSTLYDKMNDPVNPIDVVNFESAVKVGASRKTTVNDMTADNIHSIGMENRGIQMETPEHYVDSNNLFGTQIRKLIMAGLTEGVDYVVKNGKEVVVSENAKKLHKMYEDIILADLAESFDNAKKSFYNENGELDKKKISELLIDEARSRGKSEDFEKAIEIDADGEFKLPLFHPLHSQTAQSLLNSIFRNRVTKQKIKGGAFIQASSFGLSEELKLVFDTDENREIHEKNVADPNYEKHTITKPKGLLYAEILLPAWSADFFKDFVDENGNIDMEAAKKALPEEIFEMVGYRIPTEDKYSMLPLKVVGFLPMEAGGAVMLPAEITTISGSDFDVDKMYIMMKQYRRVSKWNPDLLNNHLQANDFKITQSTVGRIMNKIKKNEDLNDNEQSILDFINSIPEELHPGLKDVTYEVHKYDTKKSAADNSKAARDNMKIDIMRSVLMNSNTLSSIFNPGGFDKLKDQASKMVRDILSGDKKALEMFDHMKRVQVANDNMAGKAMVGIAANHNAHHALRLWSNLKLKNSVLFNEERGSALNSDNPMEQWSYNEKGELVKSETIDLTITKNLAEFLAAVVDNAKDPVAASINYNEVTADTYSLIISTGFDTLTAAAFMSQPVIRQVVEIVKSGKTIDEAFNMVVSKNGFKTKLHKAKASNLNSKELLKNIDKSTKGFQTKILENFYIYSKQAKVLGKLIAASKADTKGLQASLASGEIIQESIKNLIDNDGSVISGMAEFLKGEKDSRHVDMFTEYGVNKPIDILQQLFPYNSELFSGLKERIGSNLAAGRDLSEKQRNTINDHIVNYFMSRFDYFNPNERSYVVEDFPKEFLNYVKDNPELKSNRFVKALEFNLKDKRFPVDRILVKNTGGMTAEEKTDVNVGFKDLFNSEHKDFVEKLIKYAYFTSGLGFGAMGYSHFIPTDVYLELIKDSKGKSVSDYMYSIKNLEYSEDISVEFFDQFHRNMASNTGFVPRLNEANTYALKDGVVTMSLDKNSGLIAESGSEESGTRDKPVEYISINLDNTDKLFKLESLDSKNIAKYVEVQRLGIKSFATEYVMNMGSNVESAIKVEVKEDEYSVPLPTEDEFGTGGGFFEEMADEVSDSTNDVNNSSTANAESNKKECI